MTVYRTDGWTLHAVTDGIRTFNHAAFHGRGQFIMDPCALVLAIGWIINNIQPEKLVNVREKKTAGGLESPANSCEVISGDARAWTFNSHR